MQENAQKEGTILSIARVDAWIDTVDLLWPDNELRGGQRQKLYAYQYSKKLLNAIHEFLGIIICFVKLWEPGKLNTKEVHGTI